MSVLMRRARPADLETIMHLERETFADDAWPEEAMRRELESPHSYYLIAVDDDAEDDERRLLGYAGLLAPSGSEQGDIQTIAVAPFARGIGLGRGLMHALITQARRRHLAELFLEVRADNPIARALYESLGFQEIGVRRRYYRGGIDAILMRLAVPAAVTRPAASGTDSAAQGPRRAPGTGSRA